MFIPTLNIAICTHNRANDLKRCLQSIINDAPSFPHNIRVLVVNNNSNDSTQAIIESAIERNTRQNLEITSIFEAKTGKINALKHVFKNCHDGHTLFLDDDNELPRGCLGLVARLIGRDQITIFGSHNIAKISGKRPYWFDSFASAYACGTQDQLFQLTYSVWGAGMICPSRYFRILAHDNFQFSAPGRRGKKLTSGSDSEITMVMQICGARVEFPENYFLFHHIDSKRLHLKYLFRLAFNFGITDTHTDPYKALIRQQVIQEVPKRFSIIRRHLGFFLEELKSQSLSKLGLLKITFSFFYNLGYIQSYLRRYQFMKMNFIKINDFYFFCQKEKLWEKEP